VSAMTKRLACLWLCLTLVLIAIATYIALSVVPADADQGNVGRILYYHLPNWVATLCCFLTNLIASITYLASRNRNANLALMADAVAVSTAEIGLLFCSLGLITGSIWGRDLGRTLNRNARSLADLCRLPRPAKSFDRRPEQDAGCGACHLCLLRCSNRLYVNAVVAHTTSRAGFLWWTQCRH
jgi:ABC-type transport system involved in cytochrome c biogenesis permease subunit